MILKAKAENGSLSLAWRSNSFSVDGSTPVTGGISNGDGRKSNDSVEQLLDAFIFEGCPAEHRSHLHTNSTGTNRPF